MFPTLKNSFNSLFPSKGVAILLSIAVILVLFVITVALLSGTTNNGILPNIITPTPVLPGEETTRTQRIAPTQKTIIEKTTQNDVEKLPTVENKSILPNGSTLYTFASPFISRKNEAIVQDNRVIFERVLIPEKQNDPGHVTISEYKRAYGTPQEEVKGSHFYGNLMKTYIYAKQGFALIGNPFTDDVLEIHIFAPTTVDQYKKLFGEDIVENAPAGEL